MKIISLLLATAMVVLLASVIWAKAGRNTPGFDLVYPPMESELRFSHRQHKEIDCLRCHESISDSNKVEDRNLPPESLCGECHKDSVRKQVYEKGSPERCGLCHNDYDQENKTRPSRIILPPANLRFSHNQHVLRMVACDTCHKGIADSGYTTHRHLPDEAQCLGCHERRPKGKGCTTCHSSETSGRMTTSFNGLRLVPGRGSANHHRNWLRRHGSVVSEDPDSCRDCHQQRDCNSCHDGIKKPLNIHPEDYVTTHSTDARKNRHRCNSCHRYQTFCLSCHRKLGLTTDAKRKSDRKRIHPLGFGDCKAGPSHHSFQAKRSLVSCVACHSEEDCLRCHRAGAQCGGGVRIHGHLSNGQLSRMQKKNPRACRKCHANK